MLFGDNLRKLRKEKKYTQKELAEKIFVTRQAVTKWENNQSVPDIETIKMIAKVLETNVAELIYDDTTQGVISEKTNEDIIENDDSLEEVIIEPKKTNSKKLRLYLIIAISTILLGVCLYFSVTSIINLVDYNNEHSAAVEEAKKPIYVGAYYSFDEETYFDSLNDVMNADLPMVIFNEKSSFLTAKYFEAKDAEEYNLYLPIKKFKIIYEHIIVYYRTTHEFKLDRCEKLDFSEHYGVKHNLCLEGNIKLYLNIIEPIKEVTIISHNINYEQIATDVIEFNEEGKLVSSINSILNDYSIGRTYHISGAIGYTLKLTYYDGYTEILNVYNSGPILIFLNQPDASIKNTSYSVWFIIQG